LAGETDLALSSGGAVGGPPPTPALTAPVLHTPPGHHQDTQSGVERPGSGRAPSARRWWMVGLPLVGLLAGVWLALRSESETPGPALDSSATPTESSSEPVSVVSGPLPTAAAISGVPTERRVARDAGPSAPTITLGRPADSVTSPARPRRARPPRSRPARPPSAPRDELGY
jgi:hypothetical protein